MYHPPSKKKAFIARVFTYSLMTISVLILVIASLLYTLGYRFDTKDNQLELSGLIQFVTTPADATVEIDGIKHSQTTPTKETVTPGSHEVVMWREGYETWRKTLNVPAGTLTWLNYTRLVPKERQIESVASIPTLSQMLASPDKRFMAAVPDANKPTFTFYNITADNVATTTVTLAATDFSESATPTMSHRFTLDEWDRSGRYMTVKHMYGDKTEWLVIDRQDGKLVVNLTRTFGMNVTKAYFADNNATVLYAMVDDDIRKINVRAETVSAPLVSDVSEFQVYGDVIGYVHIPDTITGSRKVGLVKDGESPVLVYSSLSPSTIPVHVTVSHYFDNDYVAVSDGPKVTIFAGDFPTKQTERSRLKQTSSFTFSTDVAWLQLSPSGRFVLAQNAASYVGYDLERKEKSPVAMLSGTTDPRPLKWLDDYYVWSDRSDTFTMREFDGANQHAINSVVSGFDATLSSNGRWLYTAGKKSDGHFQLQRVRMILP